MKTKSYIEIDYNELEKMIEEYFGIKEYSIVADQEWGNDEQHAISVEKREHDSWDLRKLEELKAGKTPMYSLRIAMQELVNNDILPEGEYLISISW